MKKNSIRKTFEFILIIFILSLFFGCKKKNIELTEEQKKCVESIQYMTFEVSCYAITGVSSVPNAPLFYHPKDLTELLIKKSYEKGCNYSILEKLMQDYVGRIDCYGVYSDNNDNANWVDDLLIKIEEERIADEISEMEDSLEEFELPPEEKYEEEIEKALEEDAVSTEYTDNTDSLLFMEFDKELFIPKKINDGLVIIHSVGENVIRSFYDKLYRLTKKEIWTISSVENAKLIQTEESIYSDERIRPEKIIISTENDIKEVEYNASGFITKIESFDLYKDERFITSYMTREYDDDNRILNEETIEVTYKDEKYKKIDYKFTKKHVYKYNEGEDIPPDSEYFEDGILKMKNKYSTEKGTYTSQIFFEDGFSVKTYYEEELKVRDVFYQNDEVTREKIYER